MKNLSIIAVFMGLLLLSCKEKANVIPQTTPPPNTPPSPAALTNTYTQQMGKQWLLGRRHYSIYKRVDQNGNYYNDTFDANLPDTTVGITVVSDTVITFMGQTYNYTDTTTGHWLRTSYADTNNWLVYYVVNSDLHGLSFINYYYKQDSVVIYKKSGGGFGFNEHTFYSK